MHATTAAVNWCVLQTRHVETLAFQRFSPHPPASTFFPPTLPRCFLSLGWEGVVNLCHSSPDEHA